LWCVLRFQTLAERPTAYQAHRAAFLLLATVGITLENVQCQQAET